MKKLRILLADDHPIVLHGMRMLIASQPDMEVVGVAEDGPAAIELAADLDPDVLVLDVTLPHLSGVKVARELRERLPDVRILVLSIHENPAYLRLLLESGADGYIVKRAVPEELMQAIRTVAEGGTYLDPRLAKRMVGSLIRGEGGTTGVSGVTLSEREAAVLRCMAQGYSAKEIAALLSISGKTVDTYRARAMEKLGLHGRSDVVRYAVHVGWLDGT